jgi:hypothetical protein
MSGNPEETFLVNVRRACTAVFDAIDKMNQDRVMELLALRAGVIPNTETLDRQEHLLVQLQVVVGQARLLLSENASDQVQ